MCLLLWLHVGHPFWLSYLGVLIPMYIKRKKSTFYSSEIGQKGFIWYKIAALQADCQKHIYILIMVPSL